jgi:hypothetical protein
MCRVHGNGSALAAGWQEALCVVVQVALTWPFSTLLPGRQGCLVQCISRAGVHHHWLVSCNVFGLHNALSVLQ